jgi:hypothetical protein
MGTIREAQTIVQSLAPKGPVKERIFQAASKLPFSANRVKDLWYADTRVRLTAEEWMALRRAAQAADSHRRREALAQGDPAARIRELEALVAELSRALGRS